jgi:hypothetical protein
LGVEVAVVDEVEEEGVALEPHPRARIVALKPAAKMARVEVGHGPDAVGADTFMGCSFLIRSLASGFGPRREERLQR